MCVGVCAQSCPTLCNLVNCNPLVPLSMESSRQEYCSGLPFQGIFPARGSHPHLLWLMHWQGDSLPLHHLGRPFSMGTSVTQWCLILCNLMDCSPLGSGAGPILTTHSISELCVLLFVAFSLHVWFLIGVELLYNFVLVSAVQQRESAMSVHISPPSWASLTLPAITLV